MKSSCTPRTPRRRVNPNLEMNQTADESLQVFCRLRPNLATEKFCISVVSPTTVQLTLPESSKYYKVQTCNEYQYSFKRVFPETTNQKEIFDDVALPLVYQLIKGQNGLLLTYGVTGSGKTYTMTGAKQNSGVMPRCLDVLFNSITDYQAQKFVFKPDRMNGFDVQSEEDAQRDLEKFLKSSNNRLKKNESVEDLTSNRSKEDLKIEITEEDNAFAVFVTYVEIYNNNVYDLLENVPEVDICYKPQLKLIRKDASDNMFVHGVTELEVKSTKEAFEVFYKGQKRRKMARTILNAESSRSHSIFTIRLVQAPLDVRGEAVIQEKEMIRVSQLSLVDLAGIERTNRTRNYGDRLREAGNINNSLMALRKCLETLRENQKYGTNEMIPSRDYKLTHLFKNFFEGQGHIRMIVCVNPRCDDCDENYQVMQFAEVSQEIFVKPTPMKTATTIGLTPGRRRAHQAYKKNMQILEEVKEGHPVAYIPDDAEVIYSLEPFPDLEDVDVMDVNCNKKLINFLDARIKRKEELRSDLLSRVEKFRMELLKRNDEYLKIKQEAEASTARLTGMDIKVKALEEKVVSLSSNSSSLKRKCDDYSDEVAKLKRQLETKAQLIDQCTAEKYREKIKIRKMAAKTEKLAQEKENNLKDKRNMEMQLKEREKCLRRVKKVLDLEESTSVRTKIPRLNGDHHSDTECSESSEVSAFVTPSLKPRLRPRLAHTVAVSNPRYDNQKRATHGEWLDHQQTTIAPLNTILQPVLRNKKSFTPVTSPKEIRKSTKYCLTTQNPDENGDVETQIFKGDVLPTAAGGAKIIFNEVETLKQLSPDNLNSNMMVRFV